MQRVKNIDYDEDDLYDDDDYAEEEQGYSAEDRENFANLTPVVRAELEEAGVQTSDKQIEDALWHYYWDVGKSVTYLKGVRKPEAEAKKEKPKSKFDEAAQKNAQKADNLKGNSLTNGITKKVAAIKLESSPAAPEQTKVRSKGLDVLKLWTEERPKRKASAAFVVVGHVDHGKSTLMGRLLLDTGAVAQRDIDKYKKQATELGKSSFALAWVMDTGTEERERGVTVDIAQHHFSADEAEFTILDAPGHRDFVPNMIGGASMADFAVLVIDANQLESGMKGQTREHILLARAVGLRRIVVAVNKLDMTVPPWSQEKFDSVKNEITVFLEKEGFDIGKIIFVPCSGLSGENVVKPSPGQPPHDWIAATRPTLLHALEQSIPQATSQEKVEKPFRMQITDVFRGGITNPLSIAGRIAYGQIQVGDSIIVQPSGESAAIKAIEVNAEARDWAVVGELCNLHLTDVDAQYLRSGDTVCDSRKPVVVTRTITVDITALESLLPQSVDVHVGRLHVPGAVNQLLSTLDAKGEVLKKKPRIVKAGQRAVIKITLESPAPLEAGGGVVLRAEGSTIAAGSIQQVNV